jgi:hypothetical protein
MNSLELTIENIESGYDFSGEDVKYGAFSAGVFEYHPSSLTLKTERTCTPAVLSGEIPDVSTRKPQMGATVRLRVDGITVFIGRIFSTNINRWGVLSFTAYDVMRYLKNTYSYFYPRGYSPKTVIEDIANHYGLEIGKIADMPDIGQKLMIDNESCFDVISKVVDTATVLTQRILVFYANNNKLCLSYADEMIDDIVSDNEYLSPLNQTVIGDNALATEYELSTSIDDDTYDQIFLYRESNGAGSRTYKSAQDSINVNKWGVLRLTESVEDHVNNEQMQDKANKLLEMKNRPFKTMRITALGIVGLRAGMMITIHFPSLDDEVSKRQQVVIDSIEHKFEDGVHTMDMEVRTFWRDTP